MEQGFQRLETLINSLSGQMSDRFDKVDARFDRIESRLVTVEKNTSSQERRITNLEDDNRVIKNKLGLI
ncbi:MAG: hypothetical protein V4519_01825 [Patescibacteria group bacterium]